MCGIFGVWNFKGTEGRHLRRASALLAHRGPDDEGILVEHHGRLTPFRGDDGRTPDLPPLPDDLPTPRALLHRRLSIIGLSHLGHQPMRLPHRDVYLVFNGEIYNYRELAQRYGLHLRTDTDTEVVLALYDKLGTAAFGHMRGMWALALLDLEKNTLLLCRDRFGIKPLYYVRRHGGIAFSSELKPLLALPGVGHGLKKQKLLEFVVYGATTDPDESFADGIQSIKPGTWLDYNLSDDACAHNSYYSLPAPRHFECPTPDFESVFNAAVKEHLVSDVEVGSCLSGGLDSSLITAQASRAFPDAFQTFTCTFPGEPIDEADWARGLSSAVPGLRQHFVSPASGDLFAAIDDMVRAQERPIGSASVFAQYAVMKSVAAQGVKVVLDGQGADEVFGGYYPFAGAYLLGLLRRGKPAAARREYRLLKQRFNPRMDTAALRAAYYALPPFLQAGARRANRSGFDLLAPDLRTEAKTLRGPQRGSADFDALTARSISFGLKELLHYEDRNSMRFGVESRVPFLDHRLVEWAVHAPPEAKIHEGWTKYPLRKALEKHGAPKHAWRVDKLGFAAPQKRWRDELDEPLRTALESPYVGEFFDRRALDNLFGAGLDKNTDQTGFWRVMFLLKWLDGFKPDIS